MIHDIPAKSRLFPTIPITSPQFVYRKARETDVRTTFARARAGLESSADRGGAVTARAGVRGELAPRVRLVR
jgi:hypothetical protein